jgi:hypothetical protein
MEVSCSVGDCLWKYGISGSGTRTLSHHYLSGIGLRGIGEHEGIG